MKTFKRTFPIVVASVIAGIIIGAVTTAEAVPTTVALNAGDGVTCSGAMISDTRMNLQCDIAASTPTPTPTPTSTPTASPTTLPPTTTPPVTTPPGTTTAAPTPSPTTPSPSPTTPSTWPGAGNTGVPPFAVLTAYTGPCTINTPNTVIDLKSITCPLTIHAANVLITRSKIAADSDPLVYSDGSNVTISDTTLVASPNRTGITGDGFTATRLNISGGNRGATCTHCTIQDSWIHGQRVTGSSHASGLRADQYSTFRHNRISCDGPGQLCSGDITGYPDFQITTHWTIDNNMFDPAPGTTFCVYGGSTGGKPYSNAAGNGTFISFTNNVFNNCGNQPGEFPQSGFDKTKTGNAWTNNRFTNGTLITV